MPRTITPAEAHAREVALTEAVKLHTSATSPQERSRTAIVTTAEAFLDFLLP